MRDTHAEAGLIKGETFWVNGGSDVKTGFPSHHYNYKGLIMLANYPGQSYMEAFTTGAGAIHHTGRNLISPELVESGLRKVKPTNFHLFVVLVLCR